PTHARTARWAEQRANETKARLIPGFRHRVIERPDDPSRSEQAVPRTTGMRWSSGVGGRAPAPLPFGRTEEALRRRPGESPNVGVRRARDGLGGAGHVCRVVDLLHLRRILDHEIVRVDEVREYVVAGAVSPDSPLDLETGPLQSAASAQHRIQA